jgi:hypothetical protein
MMAMRVSIVVTAAVMSASSVVAQSATVSGEILLKETGQQLGFTTVSVLSQGTQLLTNESGKFLLLNLPPGEVRLRFKRIGFSPKDTTVTVAANDTARVRIEMTRLVIQLPTMVVSGKCTNESPRGPKTVVLAELFDQINQNAERIPLLASAKPFYLDVFRVRGIRGDKDKVVPVRIDTVRRRPIPPNPYRPKQVIQRGEGADADGWVLALPELPDFADTAFTNNHCFHYMGQTRYQGDSVIQVDYEPVPWLEKEVDIKGSMYLKVDGYQLVATVTKLNRIPPAIRRSGLDAVTVRARFSEIVTGVPVLDEWEMNSQYRYPARDRVELGQVFALRWADSLTAKPDTVRR